MKQRLKSNCFISDKIRGGINMSKTQIQILAEKGDTKGLVVLAKEYEKRRNEYLVSAMEYKYGNQNLYDDYRNSADKEFEKAVKCYKKAGELGEASAMYRLGVLYSSCNQLALAKSAYRKAAEMGDVKAARAADSIKDSDVSTELVGTVIGLSIPVFFVAMFIFSLVNAAHPLLLSFLAVVVWIGFGIIFLTDLIKNVMVGRLLIIGVIAAVIAIYKKFT